MSQPSWTSIKEVIQTVCQEQKPDVGLSRLLEGVAHLTGAHVARFALLSLRNSGFTVEYQYPNAHPAGETIPFASIEQARTNSCPVVNAIAFQRVERWDKRQQSKSDILMPSTTAALVVPILRNGSSLGALILENTSGIAFLEKDLQTAETAVAIAIILLEKRASLDLLKAVQQPIDFYQPLDRFLDDLLVLISEASGMKYIAIRELQPDGVSLRCVAHFGFGDAERSLFDFTPVSDASSFAKAIGGETVIETDVRAPHLDYIRENPLFRPIKSFVVVPVRVGTSVFGTLSFAAECPYSYSELEIAGFITIANSIGVSISNYRNAESVHEIFVQNARVAISFTALEVAQAARHEARGSLDNCQLILAKLLARSSKFPKEEREVVHGTAEELETSLLAVVGAIDKIRNASKLPEMQLHTVKLQQLWNEAIATVAGKISKENVRAHVEGSGEISAYPEALRLAFLNLLLNSLDAFHELGKKSGRRIVITIDEQSAAAQQVRIRYHDNASGIDPTRLKVPADLAKKRLAVRDLIFELGVTSKSSGSGYGLFLVRRILATHKASIDLVDYKGGVTFDILLPKNQTLAAQAHSL